MADAFQEAVEPVCRLRRTGSTQTDPLQEPLMSCRIYNHNDDAASSDDASSLPLRILCWISSQMQFTSHCHWHVRAPKGIAPDIKQRWWSRWMGDATCGKYVGPPLPRPLPPPPPRKHARKSKHTKTGGPTDPPTHMHSHMQGHACNQGSYRGGVIHKVPDLSDLECQYLAHVSQWLSHELQSVFAQHRKHPLCFQKILQPTTERTSLAKKKHHHGQQDHWR